MNIARTPADSGYLDTSSRADLPVRVSLAVEVRLLHDRGDLRHRQSRRCLHFDKYESIASGLDNEVELAYFLQRYPRGHSLRHRDLVSRLCDCSSDAGLIRETRQCRRGSPRGDLCKFFELGASSAFALGGDASTAVSMMSPANSCHSASFSPILSRVGRRPLRAMIMKMRPTARSATGPASTWVMKTATPPAPSERRPTRRR